MSGHGWIAPTFSPDTRAQPHPINHAEEFTMGRSAISQSNLMPGAVAVSEGSDVASTPEEMQARIAQLEAQVAAQQASVDPAEALIIEGNGPHNLAAIAESKHRHLTAAELDRMVRAGECKLTERHVLCKDGWYVNPVFGG